MSEIMEFPENLDEFIKQYSFKDEKEIYTNGSELIHVFRIKQWYEHEEKENKQLKEQLKQSEEVIEEAIDKVKRMEASFIQEEHIGSARDDDCELEELRNILNKYKKEESE